MKWVNTSVQYCSGSECLSAAEKGQGFGFEHKVRAASTQAEDHPTDSVSLWHFNISKQPTMLQPFVTRPQKPPVTCEV